MTDVINASVGGLRGPGLTPDDQAKLVQAVADVRQAAASVAAPKALPTNGNLAIDDPVGALTQFVFTSPNITVMTDVAQARGVGRGVTLAPPKDGKPGQSVFRQTQFGDYPLRPGHTIAFSVEVEVKPGAEDDDPFWPSGNDIRFILTTSGAAQLGLQLTQYETINPNYRRYHGFLKNTLGQNVAGVLSQVSNNGNADFNVCNWQIARSSFAITDVDALDFDPFNTGLQDARIARAEAMIFALMTGGDVVRPSLWTAHFGDSHSNGMLQAADTADGQATVIGATPVASPLDRSWNGVGVDPVYRADGAINSMTQPNVSNDQGFAAVSTGNQSWIGFLASMLRAAFPSIGEITTANLAAGGSSAYTWAGEQAFGYVRAVAMPIDGDTITLGGRVYTFRAAPAAAYAVQIGATPTECLSNLMNAVNAEGGGFYAAGTVPHPTIWGASVGGIYGRFCAIRTGSNGNALLIAGSAPTRIAATTADLTPVAQATMTGGKDESALYLNAKERLAGYNPDVITITLGTNDANRPGYRGRGMLDELSKLVADIHRDFPTTKIIMHRPPVIATGAASSAALVNVVIPAIEEVAQANSFVSLVDVFGLGVGTGLSRILNPTDGIHLTVYGYMLMAQLFARAIAAKLGFSA